MGLELWGPKAVVGAVGPLGHKFVKLATSLKTLSFHKMHRKQGNEVKSANLVALCRLLKPFLRGGALL